MADAPNTSTYLLVNADETNLPNSRVLTGTPGSIALRDTGNAGELSITPVGLLGKLSTFSTPGYVGYNTGNQSFQGMTFIDSASIGVTNPNGVSGQTIFSVTPSSTVQQVEVQKDGISASTRSRLNFITGTNAAITVVDNGFTGAADIRIGLSGSEAPADATYILKTENSSLPYSQYLGALSTGIMKSTTTTGVVSIAVSNTDYQAASAVLTSISAVTPDRGEILVGNGGGFSGLAVGAAGTVLTSNGTGDTLKWEALPGSGTVTSVQLTSTGSTLVVTGTNPITTSGTINVDLPVINTIIPGSYTYVSLEADPQGRIIGLQSNPAATVTSVGMISPNGTIAIAGDNPITSVGNFQVDIADLGITPGTYTNANITLDQYGRVTAVSNGVAGLAWTVLPNLNPVTMTPESGYIGYRQTGTVAFTLPATATAGDNYVIATAGADVSIGFTCSANAGQTIYMNTSSGTTLTATASTGAYSVSILCIDSTTPGAESFQVIYNTGTISLS